MREERRRKTGGKEGRFKQKEEIHATPDVNERKRKQTRNKTNPRSAN